LVEIRALFPDIMLVGFAVQFTTGAEEPVTSFSAADLKETPQPARV
jgi:hypothetical protein